jgi:hydroxyacylglutathione hydrolase
VDKAKRGDMFWSPDGLGFSTAVAKALGSLVGLASFEPFEPDVLLHDGQSLGEYGLDAIALHLPGHSPGSLGILCADGEFFCGDLFTNMGRPAKNTLVDDASRLDGSVARLENLRIGTIYPGHGAPFPVSALSYSGTFG